MDSNNNFGQQNQQPVYQQPVYQQPGMPQEPKKPVGLAVASMVLGIVALVLSCCVPYLPIVLALLAVVLGAVSRYGCGRPGMRYHRSGSGCDRYRIRRGAFQCVGKPVSP